MLSDADSGACPSRVRGAGHRVIKPASREEVCSSVGTTASRTPAERTYSGQRKWDQGQELSSSFSGKAREK